MVWLVDGFIGKGTRTMLYGESGSMKSWVLLHLALCVASGTPWCGRTTSRESVLYIDEEMSERTLRYRVKRLAMGLGIEKPAPLQLISHAGVRFDDTGAQRLMDRLDQCKFRPTVVIVETLRRILVGSENEAEVMSRFWRNMDPLFLQGVTIIISHHMRKPRQEGPDNPRYRASGSTDIFGGADNAIALMRPQPKTLVLTQHKNRDVEEGTPLTLRVESQGHDGPFYIRKALESYIDPGNLVLLDLCKQHPSLTHTEIYQKHRDTIKLSYTTYWRRLQNLSCVHKEGATGVIGPGLARKSGSPQAVQDVDTPQSDPV